MRQGASPAAGRFFGKPSVLAVLLLLLLVGGITVLATLNSGGTTGGGSWNSDAVKSADVGHSRDGLSIAELNPDALLTCQVVKNGGDAIPGATCTFDFQGNQVTLPASAAAVRVVIGASGSVTADAAGYYPQTRNVTVTGDATEIFGLFPIPVEPQPEAEEETVPVDEEKPGKGPNGQSGSGAHTGDGTGSTPDVAPPPTAPPGPKGWQRVWRQPITVGGGNYEPHIMGDRWGTLYFAPTNVLMRSDDGGTSWIEITPTMPSALPVVAGDTAVNVAPDGSLWWTRYWGYASGTLGCRSVDRGNSWTCDNTAIPGVTDRMWIAGKDRNEGYLQTGEALSKPEWAYTNDGSFTYQHPCAIYTQNGQTGNMLYDSYPGHAFPNPADTTQTTGKVLVYTGGSVLWVNNPNGCYAPTSPLDPPSNPGFIQNFRPGFGGTGGIPWLQVDPRSGAYWSASNPGLSAPSVDATTDDALPAGSRGLAIGRSLNEGQSWESFPVKTDLVSLTDALSITMSYASVGPQDLPGSHIEGDLELDSGPDIGDYMITMFYGSDNEGPPQATGNDDSNPNNGKEENMGQWSLYVASMRNAHGPSPVIEIEKVVDNVHIGNVCIGLLCEQTGSDPSARFAGDLLGTFVDQQGLGHIAFQIGGEPKYTRQDWVYYP